MVVFPEPGTPSFTAFTTLLFAPNFSLNNPWSLAYAPATSCSPTLDAPDRAPELRAATIAVVIGSMTSSFGRAGNSVLGWSILQQVGNFWRRKQDGGLPKGILGLYFCIGMAPSNPP